MTLIEEACYEPALTITDVNGKPTVVLRRDGSVALGDGVTPDVAARCFYDELQRYAQEHGLVPTHGCGCSANKVAVCVDCVAVGNEAIKTTAGSFREQAVRFKKTLELVVIAYDAAKAMDLVHSEGLEAAMECARAELAKEDK